MQVPLPEDIDGIFGESNSDHLHLAVSEASLEHACETDDVFDDGHAYPQTETSMPVSAQNMSAFSKHIGDVCMSVPATLTMQLPWETGVMQQIAEDGTYRGS